MAVKSKLQQVITIKQDVSVNVVIVCKGASSKLNYRSLLLGMPMCEWVAGAFEGYNITFVDEYDDYCAIAKEYSDSYTYTIVISGNMPLLNKDNIASLVQYGCFKQAQYVKFTGGIMINNEYLRNTQVPSYDCVYTGDFENFYLVENKIQLNQIIKVLTDKIVQYHIANGVEIYGKVTIEPKVEIESGVTIFGGNVIKGYSYISSGTILKENNVISDSIIGSNCALSSSIITNSKLGNNCFVMPFCVVENKTIADNTTINK